MRRNIKRITDNTIIDFNVLHAVLFVILSGLIPAMALFVVYSYWIGFGLSFIIFIIMAISLIFRKKSKPQKRKFV